MNLIVDMNPYLKREYEVEKFIKNKDLDAISSDISIEGMAKEILKLHDILGAKYGYLTLLGGESGFLYENILKESVENIEIVKTKDEIRELIKINAEEDFLKVFTKRPRITMEEEQEFYSTYMEKIDDAEITIINDDLKEKEDSEKLKNLSNISYKKGKKIAIVPNSGNIEEIIDSNPFLIILDKNTLESYLNCELDFEWEINKAINSILNKKASEIIFINNKDEISLYKSSGIQRAIFKKENKFELDKTRAITGYSIGIEKNYDKEMCLQVALACGKLSAEDLKEKTDASRIKELMKFIEIERYNAV